MRLLAFSVYDAKAEQYLQPFFLLTRGQAIRSFGDAVNQEGHDFNRHAADFTLFHVGEFDQSQGEFKPCVPEALGNALIYRTDDVKTGPVLNGGDA